MTSAKLSASNLRQSGEQANLVDYFLLNLHWHVESNLMVKIPTYNSRLTPQPTFTKPVAPKGMAENIANVADYANAIADEQAEIKAYEKGFKTQQANVDNFVANFTDASISGTAFSKGARAAFVSNFKTNAENELNDYALKHNMNQKNTKRNLKFIKKKFSNVLSVLLPDMTNYLVHWW